MANKRTNKSNKEQKERLLVSLYCSGVKTKEIAKKVGIHYSTARKWIVKPHIKEQIAQKTAEIEQKNEKDIIKKSENLEKLKDIINFDPAELFDKMGNLKEIKDMSVGARKLLAGIDINETIVESSDGSEVKVNRTKKLKWYSLMDAIKEVNKMLGYLAPAKQEHSGKDGGPIETKMTAYPSGPLSLAEWEKQVGELHQNRNETTQDTPN